MAKNSTVLGECQEMIFERKICSDVDKRQVEKEFQWVGAATRNF